MNTQFLQLQIFGIESKRNNLEWLIPYLPQVENIVHFGCDLGGQTLALMWLFKAQEAIGVDIDADDIVEARNTLHVLETEILQAHRAMDFSWTPEEDRLWWSKAPTFFTRHILEPGFSLQYLTKDITQPTEFQDNYYDLAFCDHVLHHIWYDDSRENAEQDTQFAINEMSRVVKPGGTVAACELIQSNDEARLDFARLFERAGLKSMYVQEEEFEVLGSRGWVGRYVYTKEVSNAGNGI